MVPYKPFAVLVRAVAQEPLGDGSLGNPQFIGEAIGLQAYYEPLSSAEAFQRWGVTLHQPASLMCDPADAGAFASDAEVIVDGRLYRVAGLPEIFDPGLETDYAEVKLEAKEYGI
jgi:hypothetical protein